MDLLPSAIDAVMSRRSVTWGKEPKSPSKFISYVIGELLDNDFVWHEEVIAPAMKNFNESRINDALQGRDETGEFRIWNFENYEPSRVSIPKSKTG